MNQYAILRRNGWKSPDELHAAAARSNQVTDQMPDEIRWIRMYVFAETDGTFGTLCVCEAASTGAIEKHAKLADVALTEIRPLVDTVIVRADPAK